MLGLSVLVPKFDVILPVGISFYTFQALSYTMDVYRKEITPEKNIFRYALFVSFFPQLVAGPIERSKNLLTQLRETHKFDYLRARSGLLVMLWGFFLKLVIADRAAILVNTVYDKSSEFGGVMLLFATICFALQIYCDFASYSIIAKGAAKVMGFELITVPMLPTGPDMDMVEELVKDPKVKGIWCVPKYSNPTGNTYSDETVTRLAKMECAAPDFRIIWDNAYVVHDLYDGGEKLLNVLEEAKKNGTEDMFYIFASTSKISFAGSGIAVFASSKRNIEHALSKIKFQTIGPDKINQLRHMKLYPNLEAVKEQMEKHASIIRPKFDLVLEAFEKEFSAIEGVWWSKPKGGYFVSLNLPEGKAKKVVALAKEAGLVLTPAGASFPYGKDPLDSNIRIAPTYPTIEELKKALELLCVVVKLVCHSDYEK
jgi:aspartate/methionine/tyrosine aminotransferase